MKIIVNNNKKGSEMIAKKMSILVSVYSAIFLAIYTKYSIKQTTFWQFIVIFMVMGFLALIIASAITLFTGIRKSKHMACIPLSICLIVLIFMFIVTPRIKDMVFNGRLVKYEKIVNMIRNNELKIDTTNHKVVLPDEYKHLSYLVLGEVDKNGVLTVEFFTGIGFPVKHSGYMYRSDGNILSDPAINKRWHNITRKNDNWYYFSD
jgi:hypothetical protein